MEPEAIVKRLEALIPHLEREDCFVEPIDDGIRISFYDGQVFDVYEVGDLVQVSSILITEEEMSEMPYRDEVLEFVMRLNSRAMGCRFALEPEGDMILVDNIPLDKIDEESVSAAVWDISNADFAFYDLIRETGRTGIAPTEEEIEETLLEKEADHYRYH